MEPVRSRTLSLSLYSTANRFLNRLLGWHLSIASAFYGLLLNVAVVSLEDWDLILGRHRGWVWLSSALLTGVVGFLAGDWALKFPGAINLVLAVLASCTPSFLVGSLANRRRTEFQNQLPQAMDALASTLKAGYSLVKAIEFVANEMAPPAGVEFGRVRARVRLGVSLDEALEQLGRRQKSDDLKLLIDGLALHRQVGGNMVQMISQLALLIRQRVELEQSMKAIAAQGRATQTILMLLVPGFAMLWRWAQPEFWDSFVQWQSAGLPMGALALTLAILLYLAGAVLVRRLLDIDF